MLICDLWFVTRLNGFCTGSIVRWFLMVFVNQLTTRGPFQYVFNDLKHHQMFPVEVTMFSFWVRTCSDLLGYGWLHQGPSRAKLGSLVRGSTLQRTPPKVMSAPGPQGAEHTTAIDC